MIDLSHQNWYTQDVRLTKGQGGLTVVGLRKIQFHQIEVGQVLWCIKPTTERKNGSPRFVLLMTQQRGIVHNGHEYLCIGWVVAFSAPLQMVYTSDKMVTWIGKQLELFMQVEA